MKKIIFIIILFGINILRVSAEEWQLEKIEGDNVEVEYRYKWYKENVVGDYFLYSQSITSLPLVDKENYKYTSYSQWKDTCLEPSDVIDVEESEVYPYKRLLDTKYVRIKNLENANLKINELIIKSNGENVSYNVLECDTCSSVFDNNEDTYLEIVNNEVIVIEIPSYARTENLNFIINSNSGNIQIELSFTKTEILGRKELNLKDGINNYILDSSWIILKKYTSIYYSIEKPENNFFNTVYAKENKCRERKKMYFFYRIEKEYYDDNYHKFVSGYIKDLEDYVVMYRLLDVENEENNNEKNEETLTTNIDKDTIIKDDVSLNNNENTILKEEETNNGVLEEKNIPKTNDNISIYIYLITVILIFFVSLIIYFIAKRKMSNEYYR